MAKEIVLAGACRTALGKFGGTLTNTPAVELGAIVIKEAIRRAGIKPEDVDEVLMGNVLQAGLGQSPARQAAVKAGIPVEVPALTINNVCGSGLKVVNMAAAMIEAGEADVMVVGGMENMSAAPYAMPQARFGYRMNDGKLVDVMIKDGLWDAFNDYHMGITAENVAEKYGITRQAMDEFAFESQRRAAAAIRAGVFKNEIIPVVIPQRKKDPIVFDTDEQPRETSLEALAKLKPVFRTDGKGLVTAGNSCGRSDAGAALLLMSGEKVKELGVKPMARIVGQAIVGVDPRLMGIGPVPAVRKVLAKAGMKLEDIGMIELNEAFAAQSVAVINELGLDRSKVNVSGGAIALGHPLGATGSRILTTLVHGMKRTGAKYGIATLCMGGGQGGATLLELVD